MRRVPDESQRRCTEATRVVARGPVCPTFCASGLQTGLGDDYQWALDCIAAFGAGDDEDWKTLPERVIDQRTALVVETIRWALLMPNLRWMVAEQVSTEVLSVLCARRPRPEHAAPRW